MDRQMEKNMNSSNVYIIQISRHKANMRQKKSEKEYHREKCVYIFIIFYYLQKYNMFLASMCGCYSNTKRA